jgi:hypothetical protein
MAPPPGQIELCSRHRRLEELPACLWIAKPQVPASSSLSVRNFSVLSPVRDNGDYSQHHGSAQYFHGIATDAHIANASPFPRCPDMHFAWATALDALPNHQLLITFCDAVLNHPTRQRSLPPIRWLDLRHRKKTFVLELRAGLRAARDKESRKSSRRCSSETPPLNVTKL